MPWVREWIGFRFEGGKVARFGKKLFLKIGKKKWGRKNCGQGVAGYQTSRYLCDEISRMLIFASWPSIFCFFEPVFQKLFLHFLHSLSF
jgi:hypothetical protein